MLNKLILRNWKSHFDAEYDFSPGVNIIAGPMGAGKSSIFQAITFALFGSLPEIKSRDIKTVELVNRHPNAEETQIKLLFSRDREFAIRRSIHKKDGTGNATIRDEQDQLAAGPKPTAATAFVNEILKTDLDTFLRTVYAKQNEIDLFLKYSPSDRKKYIDELMKLNKFELARKHSTQLQNKIKTRLDANKKLLETTNLEKLSADIKQLTQDLINLNTKKKTFSTDIEKTQNNEQVLKQKLDQLRNKKSEVDGLKQKLELLNNQIEQLKNKLNAVQLVSNKQEILTKIQLLQNKLSEFKNEKSKIRVQIETLEAQKLAIARELAVLETKKHDLSNRKKEFERLSLEVQQINDAHPELNKKISELKQQCEQLNQKYQSLNAEVNNIIENHAELKKAGAVCPVCTTQLTTETKQQLIDTRKRQIIELNKEKIELQNKLSVSKKELETLETLAIKQKHIGERQIEVQKACDELKQFVDEKELSANKKSEVEQILATLKNKTSELENNMEIHQNTINKLTDQKSLYDAKEQLDTLKIQQDSTVKKLAVLSFDPSVLSNTENQHAEALKKVHEISAQKQNIDTIITEKNIRKAELTNQQTKLAKLSETIASCSGKIEFLSKFNNALLTTQEALRIDLITTVNEVMSSIWTDIYPYDKWQDIRLLASEADYTLQICDENNDYFSVAGFASGGERMLAALAMRIAFAKVLAPHLSLLILDEPTHNLDQKAIDTFLEILQNKLSNYLNQIFIITHDTKLAEVGKIITV